jgi:hypothetical protein
MRHERSDDHDAPGRPAQTAPAEARPGSLRPPSGRVQIGLDPRHAMVASGLSADLVGTAPARGQPAARRTAGARRERTCRRAAGLARQTHPSGARGGVGCGRSRRRGGFVVPAHSPAGPRHLHGARPQRGGALWHREAGGRDGHAARGPGSTTSRSRPTDPGPRTTAEAGTSIPRAAGHGGWPPRAASSA